MVLSDESFCTTLPQGKGGLVNFWLSMDDQALFFYLFASAEQLVVVRFFFLDLLEFERLHAGFWPGG